MLLAGGIGCLAEAAHGNAATLHGELPKLTLAGGIDCAAMAGLAQAATCLAKMPQILRGDTRCVQVVVEGLGRAVA